MIKKWKLVVTMTIMAAMLVGAESGYTADKFWLGTAGAGDFNWSTANNWSLTSGGAAGAALIDGDVVIFDNNSTNLATQCDAAHAVTIQINANVGGPVSINANNVALAITDGVGAGITQNSATQLLTLSFSGLAGALNLTAPTTTINVANGTGKVTFSNVLGGVGCTLDKTGTGILRLNGGANTYGGTTLVSGGTLLVNGVATQTGTGAYTVFSGATLGGIGTMNGVATINGGAFLNPGDPAVTSGVGTLTTTKAFTFSNLSKYYIDINAGSGDKLVVGGGSPCTVTAGAQILLGTATGTLPQQYIILSVPAGAPATFTVNNTGFVQTLNGTDIELTGVAGFATPTLNQWGLILFALFIAGFAIWSIRRKNYKTA